MKRTMVTARLVVGSAMLTGCGPAVEASGDAPIVTMDAQPPASTTSAPPDDSSATPRPIEPALQELLRGYADGDRIWPSPYRDITDLLTNREFRGKRKPKTLVDAVVHGRIADVRPGFGIDEVEDLRDREEGFTYHQKAVDDPKADVVTANVVVAVIDQLGPGKRLEDTVTVRLQLSKRSDLAGLRRGLIGLGEVVLFLDTTPSFSLRRPGEHEWWGRFITVVAPDGRLSLPAFQSQDDACERALLAPAPTLKALVAEAAKPTRAVEYPAGRPEAGADAPEPEPYGAPSSTC